MTVRLEPTQTEYTEPAASCARTGCIEIYVGDDCVFCDGALETMREVLSDFGINPSVISETNITSGNSHLHNIPEIVTLPTIRVCDHLILGIPDIDETRSRLMEALLKGCFPV